MDRRNLNAKGWKQWPAFASCAVVLIGILQGVSTAQDPFTNKTYRIYPSRPAIRSAALPPKPIAKPISPRPFRIELQPAPSLAPRIEQGAVSANRLSRVFQEEKTEQESTSEAVRDIFGENPQEDIFGENRQQDKPAEQPSVSPFEKVEPVKPPVQDDPKNPFGEIKPAETKPSVQPQQDPANNPFKEVPNANPQQNPFNELPQDPNPITPPMDTTPVEPRLPDGGEFTPMPGQVDPNPPIPGEEVKPQDNDVAPGALEPTPADPQQVAPQIKDDPGGLPLTPDDEDIPDVPIPRSQKGKIYFPAKDPTAYGNPNRDRMPIGPPNYNQQFANVNPYGNLPGPYGYSNLPGQGQVQMPNGFGAQPYASPYPGYQPSPYALMPNQNLVFGAQCGPGCVPANGCGSCNVCNSCNGTQVAMSSAGCNSCATCNSRGGQSEMAAVSEVDKIGHRVVETGQTETDEDAYTPVVGDCDSLCANYTNCYFGAFGGWSDLNDLVTTGDFGSGIYQEDAGYIFGVTLGQIQGRNLRTEMELSYRNININGLELQGSVPSQNVAVFGDIGTLSGMLNGYWEFVDFGPEKFNPYIGGGLGFALARTDLIQSNGTEAVINDDESSFAWQWMAGVNYKASSSLDAFVEYRYFAADSFRLDTEIPTVAGLGNGSGTFDFRSGSVLFGMRARF